MGYFFSSQISMGSVYDHYQEYFKQYADFEIPAKWKIKIKTASWKQQETTKNCCQK